ncbi:hypothetical protein ACE193_15220 [Bernardetia sp. OM2101]|uniref:hypothetical protein n=1 Tax=Bernardetia sp. OM2101 TaxID=3344876 RepID=UPI0035D06535
MESFVESTQKALNKIAGLLLLSKENSATQDYDIIIDDVRVVPRNDNPELLKLIAQQIDEDTKKVQVRMYNGKSKNHEPKEFVKSDKALNGFGLTEQQIKNKFKKEYEEKEKLEKLEKQVEELEEENESLRKVNLGGINVSDALVGALTPLLHQGIEHFVGLKSQAVAPQQLAGTQDEFLMQLNELIQTMPDNRKAAILQSFQVLAQVPDQKFNQFLMFMNENFTDKNPEQNG